MLWTWQCSTGAQHRRQLVLRNSVLPARRPLAFLAGALAVVFCGGLFPARTRWVPR
ncbi:hypothetical protein BZL29_6390 [Mycobacterium kansasii]|uniref:Uncharacterized protein n=1 Tax=Mycobacterium kansasii TaxID=1768 RepID=A0A1V3WSL7_MYCKA|nr:hypothetical protein BZL29_6390 [Mycobacterium kansasii]